MVLLPSGDTSRTAGVESNVCVVRIRTEQVILQINKRFLPISKSCGSVWLLFVRATNDSIFAVLLLHYQIISMVPFFTTGICLEESMANMANRNGAWWCMIPVFGPIAHHSIIISPTPLYENFPSFENWLKYPSLPPDSRRLVARSSVCRWRSSSSSNRNNQNNAERRRHVSRYYVRV